LNFVNHNTFITLFLSYLKIIREDNDPFYLHRKFCPKAVVYRICQRI